MLLNLMAGCQVIPDTFSFRAKHFVFLELLYEVRRVQSLKIITLLEDPRMLNINQHGPVEHLVGRGLH